MKCQNPILFYISARQGPPCKGAAVAVVAGTAAALSEPHFLWLQLQVPPGQAGSFLNLGALALANRPPSPPAAHHPL